MVCWRKRLIFRQYIFNKTHKYGIKLFGWLSQRLYMINKNIFLTINNKMIIIENMCIKFAKKLLNGGHIIYI